MDKFGGSRSFGESPKPMGFFKEIRKGLLETMIDRPPNRWIFPDDVRFIQTETILNMCFSFVVHLGECNIG